MPEGLKLSAWTARRSARNRSTPNSQLMRRRKPARSLIRAASIGLSQLWERSANRLLSNFRFFITLIRVARPEETSETILSPSRDHMYVQVRNTLADAVVHRDERSVSLHSRLDCARQKLNAAKDRFN